MDPRPTKRAAKSRRGHVRPVVESQPVYRPQMYDPSFQPQPLYRPQMYDPSFHPPPVFNPNMYDMDPFWSPRDPRSVGDDDDDDDDDEVEGVDAVPETQDLGDENEVEVVAEAVRPKKADRKNWDGDEEEALAKSWVKVSVDKLVGDRQTKMGFWKRIAQHYKTLVPGYPRTKDQLNSKWNSMHPLIQGFNGYYIQAVRINQNGCNELNIQEKAGEDFEHQYKKPFVHFKAWNILKDQPKWLDQPVVGHESSSGSKKRKSSDSNTTPTPHSDDQAFNVPLPCLNEDPAPTRQSKGKKKVTDDSSSRHSMHNTLETYTTNKSTFLQVQLESLQKKDEEYYKYLEGENQRSDMRFVMDPHENIPDPVFKEFVVNKKREICAKWGWPCSL